jgi:meiotically up-regulated gene 157 (Mug157) protein
MAAVALTDLAAMLHDIPLALDLAAAAASLATTIKSAIADYAITVSRVSGDRVYAYEVDGFGSAFKMDDANIPSLLSLPYLGFCNVTDPLYVATRRMVLSPENPFYFAGKAGAGIGGPHVGDNYIWPMSIIMRALTSNDDAEIAQCLETLRDTTAGTYFMHESFYKDDASKFTRPWFAWANSLFGELILVIADTRPHLIF